MSGTIVDLVTIVLILGMTWALTSEGLWGAALMFFNALFAAMITLNTYEPLAQLIGTNVEFLSGYADALCILVIFTVSLLLLRLITENFAPAMVRFPMPLYHLGRLIFGLLGSLITMGMIMIALDASPVNKKILGAMDYKYKPFYGLRLDKEVLAYFQHATGYIFTRVGQADPYKEFGNVRAFDPKGDWLLRAQEARPYPKGEDLFADETASTAAAAEGGAGAAGGAPAAGGGNVANPPGMPGGIAPPGGLK
jgi:hypothetical protein